MGWKMALLRKVVFAGSIMIPISSIYAGSILEKNNDPEFKRYSVSVGWLHAKITGKYNNFDITTAIQENLPYAIGNVNTQTVLDAIDQNQADGKSAYQNIKTLQPLLSSLPAILSGSATVSQPTHWNTSGTGLEVKDIDTLGLLMKYHYNDAISFELKGGFPPKVHAKGIGTVYAPVIGNVSLPALSALLVGHSVVPVNQNILVSQLDSVSSAVTATAWLPGVEIQYQFGKPKVNKFRPYVGAGVIYAYLNNLKVNNVVNDNLILAGHRVQNILDNQSGYGLEGRLSSANPVVKVKTDDAFAPMATVGFTYDISDEWFAAASLTYAKLDIHANIQVVNSKNNELLIEANNTISVDPIISFVGIGYRF